jgi:hypothetical protein
MVRHVERKAFSPGTKKSPAQPTIQIMDGLETDMDF